MDGISTIEYGKVYLTEERYTDRHGQPRVYVDVNTEPFGGEFLERFGAIDEAKAWIEGGEPTVTIR